MNPASLPLVLALIALAAFGIFCLVDAFKVLQRNLENKKKLVDILSKQVQALQANQQHQPVETETPMNPQVQADLEKMIADTKGKFFSITFVKKDGSKRVANGKDKYFRLLKDGPSKLANNVPFVDRNQEKWISTTNDAVVIFKCGSTEKSFAIWSRSSIHPYPVPRWGGVFCVKFSEIFLDMRGKYDPNSLRKWLIFNELQRGRGRAAVSRW